MRVKLKTMADVVYAVDASERDSIADIKATLEQQQASLSAEGHRIIYRGRVLEDGALLGPSGVRDGHVLLVVPRIPRHADCGEAHGGRATNSSSPRSFQGHSIAGYDPEEAALYVQLHSGLHEMDAFADIRGGDPFELLLGVAIGFLLGCIAGLCIVDSAMSTRLKLGVLLGIGCNVSFTMLRLLAAYPPQSLGEHHGIP